MFDAIKYRIWVWLWRVLPLIRPKYCLKIWFHKYNDAAKFSKDMSWDKVSLYPAPAVYKED
jgi:hypothetical protein